jgi:ferredoxin
MDESIWMPQINTLVCNGCGECITQCPTAALGWVEGKAALLAPMQCVYCADCEALCPTQAIALPYLILRAAHLNEEQS